VELRTELNAQISKMIGRCLSKKAEDRFQSGEDLVAAVQELEKALLSKSGQGPQSTAAASEADFLTQSWFVRDSQLLTALQTQKKIGPEEALQYRGKAVYELVLRNALISEDELAACIADLLNLPWIPKARVKSLRVPEEVRGIFRSDVIQRYHILPFFLDKERKAISMIIDGATDFQRDPEIAKAFREYHFNLYIANRTSIDRLIQTRVLQNQEKSSDLNLLFTETDEFFDDSRLSDKRLLLVEPQSHYQQSMVSLFKGFESSVTLVSNLQEAMAKAKSEKFHHIWARRDVIGDELAFESVLLRNNPACDVRFYDNLGQELLEDSIHYLKFREFFLKILQTFISNGSDQEKSISHDYATLALRTAKALTQNQKELDEVYFSALLHKWEKLRPQARKLTDLLQGVFRFRHVIDCIPERFDGRGPGALKAQQIPLGSRIMACLSPLEKCNPSFKEWKPEQIKALREAFDSASGKQLDPIITTQVLELIEPRGSSSSSAKVYLVDSDPNSADQMAAQLRRIGMEVHLFADGVAAASAVKRSPPDLLLTEMMIQKLDGLSLMARLKADEATAKVPVIFISASKRPEHSMKALQMGAEDFISKDTDPQLLLTKIERFLKRQTKA
jgi:CheY-like chemotaxis protein